MNMTDGYRTIIALLLISSGGSVCPNRQPAAVSSSEWGDDRICVSFNSTYGAGNTKIFVQEGVTTNFPKHLVAKIPAAEPRWCSNKRLTWATVYRWTGLDLRDPKQWLDATVFTPGQAYTIGLEREGFDAVKQEPYCLSGIVLVRPFRVLTVSKRSGDPKPFAVTDDLPQSLLSLITRRGDDYMFADGAEAARLISKQDAGRYLLLGLEDGRQIEVQKLPDRPGNLGSPDVAGWLLGTMVLVSSMSLFFIAFLLYRAIEYADYLSEPTNDSKAVIQEALETRFGVLILFVLATALTVDWPIKSINLLLSDVKKRSGGLFDRMQLVFASTPVQKWGHLKAGLREAIEQS